MALNSYSGGSVISQYEVIQSHIKKFKDTLYTSCPAEVIKVNIVGEYIESVDVVPSVARVYVDGLIKNRPPIYKVPLVYQSGGGGLLSFPVAIGDTVLLHFMMDDNESFLSDSTPVPNSLRQFNYNDAVATPCLYPFSKNLQPSSDKVELKFRGSSISIDQEGNIVIDGAENVTVSNSTNVSIISTNIILDGSVTCTGSLRVDGEVTAGGDVVTDGGISLNTHKHGLVRKGTDDSGVPK